MLIIRNVLIHNHISVTIRYGTIEEFNVNSKAEYSALSRTQPEKKYKKKKLKQTNASAPLIRYREGSPESIRATMAERICERDEF